MSNDNPLLYYTSHSLITDPAKNADLFADLPRGLPLMHQITQNVLIHVWKIRKYHPQLLTGRTNEYEIRRIEALLGRIMQFDSAPLTVKRPTEKLLIIDCRHFATLLCAMLRHQGIPARVRCGFASYLEETHYQDHWVCEYWNAEQGRWILEDPDVKMHDVPREKFVTGGAAWKMARSGEMNISQFGYDAETRGWWVVAHDLVRDLAALNKFEGLSSDNWGIMHRVMQAISLKDFTLLDRAAELSLADNSGFGEMRDFYESQSELSVPDSITVYNYLISSDSVVNWREEV